MRRGEIFWGVLLVMLGGLFFLKTAGYLTGDVMSWFWPLLIVAAGAWMLLGGFSRREATSSSQTFSVPLEGARKASLTINHGVGRLELRSGASGNEFLAGTSAVAMTHSSRLVGEHLEVNIDAGPSMIPFIGPEGGAWILRLNSAVPTILSLHAGASQLDMDLTDLQITRLDYEGGASSLQLSLPKDVSRFMGNIRSGASSLHLRVPHGVAARFFIKTVGSTTIDEQRFVARGTGVYQSADFDTATRQAEVTLEGGATSIRID